MTPSIIKKMATESCPLARKAVLLKKYDNDVVIVSAVRSAITKVKFKARCFSKGLSNQPPFFRVGKAVSRTLNRSFSSRMSFVLLIHVPSLTLS